MLGDAVLSLPFVSAVRDTYEPFVCCTTSSAPLFATVLDADRIIAWDPPWIAERNKYTWSRWRRSGILELLRRLRSLRAGTAVCSWADPRTHALMAFCGARRRLGYPVNGTNYLASERPWRRVQMHTGRILAFATGLLCLRPLLTTCLQRARYEQHHVEDWRQLAEKLNCEMDTHPPWFCVGDESPSADMARLREYTGKARSERRGPVWLIHPGGRLPTKRWPRERFQELAHRVSSERELPLVIVSPPAKECTVSVPPGILVVETPRLVDLVRAVSMVDCVACNDSLTSHLAAALGKRAVTIFGSGSPEWFAPSGSEDLVVATNVCPHHPCMDRCVMPSIICLESINVDTVVRAVDRATAQATSWHCESHEREGKS